METDSSQVLRALVKQYLEQTFTRQGRKESRWGKDGICLSMFLFFSFFAGHQFSQTRLSPQKEWCLKAGGTQRRHQFVLPFD